MKEQTVKNCYFFLRIYKRNLDHIDKESVPCLFILYVIFLQPYFGWLKLPGQIILDINKNQNSLLYNRNYYA